MNKEQALDNIESTISTIEFELAVLKAAVEYLRKEKEQ
jgi:hypothetical protein